MRGIPEDRVRYHLCWGSMNTPHTIDVPLEDIVDLILSINAQAYSIEAANPRHEHEWTVWQDVKLPEGKILIPGIISHQTNVVEHPELVAWRIKNYASVVGRENVIAGTDCGFSQGWHMIRVHPEVQWAKLAALVEGAALASQDLWALMGSHFKEQLYDPKTRLMGMFVKFPSIETMEILAPAPDSTSSSSIWNTCRLASRRSTTWSHRLGALLACRALVRLRGHDTATANTSWQAHHVRRDGLDRGAGDGPRRTLGADLRRHGEHGLPQGLRAGGVLDVHRASAGVGGVLRCRTSFRPLDRPGGATGTSAA